MNNSLRMFWQIVGGMVMAGILMFTKNGNLRDVNVIQMLLVGFVGVIASINSYLLYDKEEQEQRDVVQWVHLDYYAIIAMAAVMIIGEVGILIALYLVAELVFILTKFYEITITKE